MDSRPPKDGSAGEDFRGNDAFCKSPHLAIRLILFAALVLLLPHILLAAPPKIGLTPPLKFSPGVPERVVLKNGAVVYLLEDHELPLINLSVELKGSPAYESPKIAGVIEIFEEVWRAGGTKTRSPSILNQILEQNAISVETSADLESASVSLNCLTKNWAKGLEIFTDVLRNPRFDGKQLSLAKARAIEALKRKNDTPGGIARRAFRDVMYGKTHVYARQATKATLALIGKNDLAELHKKIAVPNGAIFSVSGDFKRDELLEALEASLKDWKPAGQTPAKFDFSLKKPPEGRIFFVEKNFNQSRVVMGEMGISRHSPDHFPLEVANYILGEGGTSRLFADIRSRMGLAYVVGSFYTEPEGPGLAGVGGQTKAESTLQIISAFENELKKFTGEEPSAEEMGTAKDSILNSFIFRFNSPARIVAEKASLEFYGYPSDYLDNYPANVSRVSPGQVLEAAKKYFSVDQMKITVVGNKSKFGGSLDKFGKVVVIPLKDID